MTTVQQLAEVFLEKLHAGVVPWHRPWQNVGTPGKNLMTNRPYRGINWWTTTLAGFRSPYWLTFRQAQLLGGVVRKGSRSTLVVHYHFADIEHADGSRSTVFQGLRQYRVFNIEQVDIPEAALPGGYTETPVVALDEGTRIESAEHIWSEWPDKPALVAGNDAAYSPSTDTIRMPAYSLFNSPEAYYATLFHEAVHATGHGKRLGRPGITEPARFGSHRYALEELVAEMGSSRLCYEAGFGNVTIDNSAAYIQSWIRTVEETPSIIFNAASAAEKAVDFIVGSAGESIQPEAEVA